jgi:hypothetical protein
VGNLMHGTVGKSVVLYLLVLISLGAFGCSGVGRVVPLDHRLPFNEQDNSQGNFSHGGLTVGYSYSLAGGSMTMDGQVDYRRSVDSLDVRLLFLDASGTVLQQMLVYSSGYRDGGSKKSDRTFRETMVVPPGVAGLSFSYSAQPRSSHK